MARHATPLPFDEGPGARAFAMQADGSVETTLGGERVQLLPERALYWPRVATLFVADVHLGKAAAFRAGGVPVPRGVTAADLRRLSVVATRTKARRLVVLGDFLHAAAGRVPALDAAFLAFRATHPELEISLVRGNHHEKAGDPPSSRRVGVLTAPHGEPPFVLCHEPSTPPTGYPLCGHVDPGVRLDGSAFDSARLPCFVIGLRYSVLPAFGRLTGLAIVAPAADLVRVAIAGPRLFVLQ